MKKINKKGQLRISALIYGVILSSMVVIAIGYWINDWNIAYNSGLTYDLGSYNKLSEMSGESSSAQGNISVRSSTQGESFEGTSIRGVFGFLNRIFTPLRVVFGEGGMLDSVEKRFTLDTYVMWGMVTIIIFAILFALIAIFFRLQKGVT